LDVGEVSAVVTVSQESAAPLETENANVDKAITTQEVRALPQFGRDPYELARLTPGVFGDAARNTIVGPGGRQLNATLARDVRLNGTRAVTLQVNATNLLNTVQWTVLDTDINSQTFGNVIATKPMRAVTMSLRFRF